MTVGLLDLFSGWGVSFMLIVTRLAAMMYGFPFFGSPAIPVKVRVIILMLLSFLILPMAGVEGMGDDWGLGMLALQMGKETFLGLMIGFGTKFMFEAFSLAGTFAGRGMGFAMADLIDPISAAPQSMVGQFWTLVAILFFISVDGHHFLIKLMVENFERIPLGDAIFPQRTGEIIVRGSSVMYQTALKLAAPALLLMLMIDVGMALLARAMPKLQIFFIALPLKLFVGVYALIVSLQLFQAVFASMYDEFREFLVVLMESMVG